MDFYILDDDIAVVKTLKHIITERKIGTVIGYNTDVECAIEDIKEENPSINNGGFHDERDGRNHLY